MCSLATLLSITNLFSLASQHGADSNAFARKAAEGGSNDQIEASKACDLRNREKHGGNDADARKAGHLRLLLLPMLTPGSSC